jgi:hypothetical protein
MNRTDRPPASRTDDEQTDRAMRNVSHTHPYAEEGALDRLFERGQVVAADGGERNARDADEEPAERDADAREEGGEEATDEDKQMKNVDHTPPHGDGVDRVFERGGEHERAESEE